MRSLVVQSVRMMQSFSKGMGATAERAVPTVRVLTRRTSIGRTTEPTEIDKASVLKRTAFILPSAPVLKKAPPVGPDWLHEVKHDGWRAQLHKHEGGAVIFSRGGKYITGRFPIIRDAMRSLPTCIIDAEIIGCDADGIPDFHALTTGNAHGCCAWCFDLMMIEGKDVRSEPLEQRRERLQVLLASSDGDLLRFSESFDDPQKLLDAAVKLGLEGIVSKRRDQAYRSGPNSGEQGEDCAVARGEPRSLGDV
jgi:bifunctional non-homologous end joining protein LigD